MPDGKERLEKNDLKERKISDMLKQYDKQHHPTEFLGENRPPFSQIV